MEAPAPLRTLHKLEVGRFWAGLVEHGHLVLFHAERRLRAPIDLPAHPRSPSREADEEMCRGRLDSPVPNSSDADHALSGSDQEQGPPEGGPQRLGFRLIDRPGREGLFKSIKSKNPSRHGFVYEYGRNAADFRHAKDCLRCGEKRQVRLQGDILDGKCGADAVLADGTLIQRKSYRRLSGLRAAILRQVASDLRRYGNGHDPERRWKSGRDGIPLNGAIEFQVDLDRLLRRPGPPEDKEVKKDEKKDAKSVRYPTYPTEYVLAWCAELEQELNKIFGYSVNGKRPKITVKALRAGQRDCPFAGENEETAK